MTRVRCALVLTTILLVGLSALHAATTGSISGVLKDQTNLVIVGATVTATNVDQGTQEKVTTDEHGDYTFSTLPVGRYTLTFESPGFQSVKRTDVMVDTDSALKQDAILQLAEQAQEVTVAENAEQLSVRIVSEHAVASGICNNDFIG